MGKMSVKSKILFLFDNVGTDYVARIFSGAKRSGSAAGFDLDCQNIYGSNRSVEDVLASANYAGVVLTPPLSDDRHVLAHLEARGLAYVRIAPLLDTMRGNIIYMDEFDASRAIVDFMLERGHRRVALLKGPRTHLVSMRRYNGYAAALGGKGIRVDPTLIEQGDFSRQSGKDIAAALFAMHPTAIFASNDEMALGIIDAANRSGISIPNDISLVGFDDNASAKNSIPGLTTVRQPLEEMGEGACRLLTDRLHNPSLPRGSVEVPYTIVERASVARCAGDRAAA